MEYATQGTCSKLITFEVENDILTSLSFTRGCGGNLKGISALVVGLPIDTVIAKLRGIQCQNGTSCPDQLAQALLAYKGDK